jgi:Zn-dependent alcohol dehydrogenase
MTSVMACLFVLALVDTRLFEATVNAAFAAALPQKHPVPSTMRALVFRGPNQIGIEQVAIPGPGPSDAVIRATLTTICGTELHTLRRIPSEAWLDHRPRTRHELGVAVADYKVGERVLVGAITPCGQCDYCLSGEWSTPVSSSENDITA